MKLKNRRLQFFKDSDLHFSAEGRPAASKVRKDNARPHQPADLRKSKWVLGDVTEVLDGHNSWRLGKITKVLKNDYFIIRLTGCIQLREFHVSCLRVPNTYCSKQSTVIDRVTAQRKKQSRVADDMFPCSKFVMERAYEEDGHSTKRHMAVNLCPSTSARILKKKLDPRRMPPDDLIRGTSKKRKATAYEVRQPTKKALPLKMPARNDIHGDRLYRPFSDRYNDLARRKSDSKVFPSSQIALQLREENECSVASCSVNYLEYSINDNQQSVGLGSCFPDDAMSACPSISGHDKDDVFAADLESDVHELELQAYQSTVRAFYASGPLTWEQESLLTNLRLSLNISNEEHLLQLRHLLSS